MAAHPEIGDAELSMKSGDDVSMPGSEVRQNAGATPMGGVSTPDDRCAT